MKIRTKEDAAQLLLSYEEFSHQDWVEGEFWFRYDGPMDEFKRHEYTINHETEGIIGATEAEAVSYIYRNRSRLNNADPIMVNATRRNPHEQNCTDHGKHS